jgi:hypothetical protein
MFPFFPGAPVMINEVGHMDITKCCGRVGSTTVSYFEGAGV